MSHIYDYRNMNKTEESENIRKKIINIFRNTMMPDFVTFKKRRNSSNLIYNQRMTSDVRDGISRERREHARVRNLADCGRICERPRKSIGSIEEMWRKCIYVCSTICKVKIELY